MPMFEALLWPLLAAAAIAAPSAAQSGGEAASPDVPDVEYAAVGGSALMLDLYRPPGEPLGLIVWVHGGAWRAGSRKSVDLRGMTAHRWAVASVDYRLSTVARFPAQVHDIKAAIRYLRANADALGLPAAPFVIAGSSAGGHLAALVGVTNGHPELEGDVGDRLDVSSDVQAIVDLYGASNLTTILAQSTPHGLDVRRPALDLLLGGQPDAEPTLAGLASPVFHVDASDPPLLLLHGDQDNQMPINQAHELEGAYRRAGLRVRFDVVHGAGHGGPAFTKPERLEEIAAFLADAVTYEPAAFESRSPLLPPGMPPQPAAQESRHQ